MLGCVSVVPASKFSLSTNPKGSYNFEDKLNTDLLEAVLVVSSTIL